MYNKSEIMKRAHELRKTSQYSLSVSLKKAWLEAKINKIEGKLFMYDMIDRQSRSEREEVARLARQLNTLRKELNPAKKVTYIPLSEDERAEVLEEFESIIYDSPMTSKNKDWKRADELKELLNKGRVA